MIKFSLCYFPFLLACRGIELLQLQYMGLIDGYNQNNPPAPLTVLDFDILQANGDLGDILTATHDQAMKDWERMPVKEIFSYIRKTGRCSSLVKVLGDLSEMYMSHSTWEEYASMNRIFKHYHFNLKENIIASRNQSMSSYPGTIVSIDDFYYMDSGQNHIRSRQEYI